MPLGTEVGFDPGDIVVDGDPAHPTKRGVQQPSLFGSCLLWPNGLPVSATAELLFTERMPFLSPNSELK